MAKTNTSPKRGRDPRRKPSISVHITDYSTCYYCKLHPLAAGTIYCPVCNFPMRGTETEQKNYILKKRMEKSELRDIVQHQHRARNIIFFIGGINILSFIIQLIAWGLIGAVTGIVELVIGAFFVGLGFLAGTKPYGAILTALIVYAVYTFLALAFNVITGNYAGIILGVIFRLAIIGVLIYGLMAVRKIEEIRKKQELIPDRNL